MVDTALHNDIEYLILRDLMHFGNVTLPEICVLSLSQHPSEITPDLQTILPPRKTLEVYHPENATPNNIISSIAAHYTDCSFAQAATFYWNYIDHAIADGNTLTINSVAIVDMSSLGLITTSETLAHQLEPFVAPLPLPTFEGQSEQATPIGNSVSEKSTTHREPYRGAAASPSGVDRGASGTMIFIATVLVIIASGFLAYYFAIA